MEHSEDDAVYKILHKMKTFWQNQLKISESVLFKILYRIRYKKIDVILVQFPFKKLIPKNASSFSSVQAYDGFTSNDKETADQFNSYFTSTGNNLAAKFKYMMILV